MTLINELPEVGRRARRRVAVRLLPFVFLAYIVNYIDRVNVSFANLRMSADLGFSDRVDGLGVGMFYVSYVLFEIPGTLIVERWSARKWISRIMISWGIVAALTAFVHYRVPGVTWLAEATVRGVASLFDPLANSNLGWLSGRGRVIVTALRAPGSEFVLQFFSV